MEPQQSTPERGSSTSSPNRSLQQASPALERRETGRWSASGSDNHRENGNDDVFCSRCSSRNSGSAQLQLVGRHSRQSSDGRRSVDDDAVYTPPPLSSPSMASSLTFSHTGHSISPLRRELSPTTLPEGLDAVTARASRHDLARRLSILARRLTYEEANNSLDEGVVETQLHQLEKVVGARTSSKPTKLQQKESNESPSPSEVNSALGSPVSSVFKSQFSDLSASVHREREAEAARNRRDEPPPKKGMTISQSKRVVEEMSKLNDELSTVVKNLQARQEESEHIQGLLIERAERAAQRIIFLQNRVAYLEEELQENDGELQHLRICLKAVEVQLPPHPDEELQRCIAAFKNDYQALKRKRAHRASIASVMGFNSPTNNSPTR